MHLRHTDRARRKGWQNSRQNHGPPLIRRPKMATISAMLPRNFPLRGRNARKCRRVPPGYPAAEATAAGTINGYPAPAGLTQRRSTAAALIYSFSRTRGAIALTSAGHFDQRRASRTRGAVPTRRFANRVSTQDFPHTRGCPGSTPLATQAESPFPAHAGLTVQAQRPSRMTGTFPRTRGADRMGVGGMKIGKHLSPHTRG